MILCISVLSVVIFPFSFLILLIWFFSLCFLMSLANGLSILFIFSKNKLLACISNFLEKISSLSHSAVFLYFFALIIEEGFLISPCYSLELCIQWVYLSFSSLPFTFLLRSVQLSCSVVSDSLRPLESQNARPPCPSPAPRVYSVMSVASVMLSNHLILCRPLPLLPSIFPSIRVFSNESALRIRWPKYWSFSFDISSSNDTQDWSSLGWTGWISLQSKGLSRVFSNTTVQKHHFFSIQLPL